MHLFHLDAIGDGFLMLKVAFLSRHRWDFSACSHRLNHHLWLLGWPCLLSHWDWLWSMENFIHFLDHFTRLWRDLLYWYLGFVLFRVLLLGQNHIWCCLIWYNWLRVKDRRGLRCSYNDWAGCLESWNTDFRVFYSLDFRLFHVNLFGHGVCGNDFLGDWISMGLRGRLEMSYRQGCFAFGA